MESVKTLKLGIEDKHAKAMLGEGTRRQYGLELLQRNPIPKPEALLQASEGLVVGLCLQKLTNGFSKCDDLSIGSATQQQVCEEFATRLRQFKRQHLNWRVSDRKSPKYSLGMGAIQGAGLDVQKRTGPV